LGAVQIEPLDIDGAWVCSPPQYDDSRGTFLEWFRGDRLSAATGRPFDVVQANHSVSRRGVVRGIHFADVPPSQAKYVTATRGAVLDFVIDIRVGSPTFGSWDSVLLDEVDRRAIYIAEGLGHCFVALTDEATVSYLVTSPFNAEREHGIDPLDPDVGLRFPEAAGVLLLSPKDREAPSLSEAASTGLLPTWQAARDYYAALGRGEG
jgi:dTDP-4-dehydrorhamnose 3,5-epimerase